MDREDLYESIDRQIISEKIFRQKIKLAISKFNENKLNKAKKQLIAEKIYRAKIRHDLKMISEKKRVVHSSSGMAALDDLFLNSNLLSTLEDAYYSLTTSQEQRDDFENHILQAALDLFKTAAPQEDDKNLSESLQFLFEQEEADISIEVTDEELPEDKIVGPERKEREEQEEGPEDDNAESIPEEEDLTGRNKAQSTFSKIEKSIMSYYTDLGNPADKADYKTYLIANLRLYFDRWENALKNEVNPEFSPDIDQAVQDAEADIEASENEEDTDLSI